MRLESGSGGCRSGRVVLCAAAIVGREFAVPVVAATAAVAEPDPLAELTVPINELVDLRRQPTDSRHAPAPGEARRWFVFSCPRPRAGTGIVPPPTPLIRVCRAGGPRRLRPSYVCPARSAEPLGDHWVVTGVDPRWIL